VEQYIQISLLNDFIFCPRSIYFHKCYGNLATQNYHSTYQVKGLNAHKTIDENTYSTSKNILQGIDIFSEKYNLVGKIDIFDIKTKTLTERKKQIKVIYDGYILQIYAQYFCLIEMGYKVEHLKLYSKDDNKSYPIDLPTNNKIMYDKFTKTIKDLQNFNLNDKFTANIEKCKNCIYYNLCDYSLI
jgi:CRISPR-associated protein Cas4